MYGIFMKAADQLLLLHTEALKTLVSVPISAPIDLCTVAGCASHPVHLSVPLIRRLDFRKQVEHSVTTMLAWQSKRFAVSL